MQRDMDLVVRIMEGLSNSKGNWGRGYAHLMIDDHKNVDKEEPNAVLLSLAECPNRQTLLYHVDIMEQGGLVDISKSGYNGHPACRLTWEGNDLLNSIRQDGVLESVRAEHGDNWKTWAIDVTKAVFVDVAKNIALQPF